METTKKQSGTKKPKTKTKTSNIDPKTGRYDISKSGFNANPQNINRNGRPRKIYTVVKETGFSASDIRIAFGEMAFYSLDELKTVHADKNKPVLMRIVAKVYFDAMKYGSYSKIKEIIEQVVGSAKQTITADITTPKPPPLNYDKLTPDAMADLLETVAQQKRDVSELKTETLIEIARAVLSE